MNVLVVGATGYIGSAVAEELKRAGNSVIGTARSGAAEDRLRSRGIMPVRADVNDPQSLARAAAKADAAIYAVQYSGEDAFAVESAALKALVEALAPKHGTLIVVRPGDVYGRGGGLRAMFAQSAKESGAARIIGDGSNHWPVVHVEDLAKLYVLALEKAPAGAIYNAAEESPFNVREMAEAASRGAGKGGAVQIVPMR